VKTQNAKGDGFTCFSSSQMPVYLIKYPVLRLRSPVKIRALSVSGFQPDGFISHAIFPGRCPGLSCGRFSAWGWYLVFIQNVSRDRLFWI